ncbi:hypothetical protein Dimus_017134 [Dionaea muscipula]
MHPGVEYKKIGRIIEYDLATDLAQISDLLLPATAPCCCALPKKKPEPKGESRTGSHRNTRRDLNKANRPNSAEGQLEKLKDSATKIQGVLSDAEQRQEGNEAVRLWLKQLRSVVYDVDDLFYEFSTMVMRKELMSGCTLSKELRFFFSKSNQAAFACKMARQVKKIRGKLDDIAKYGDLFAFRNDIGQALSSVRRETHSFVRANEVIGRDEDRKAILEMLMLDPTVGENISVLSIVGMGD